ncbi:hypothetical protein [Microbispora sp. NPDC049125]|uniref:hypothetical protein n=1 Tax=Microbispora sp. NPDC049125 TaxID=3154929 RepID=UPI0034651625
MMYEYTAIRLFGDPARDMAEEWSTILNDLSALGWRLVAVHEGYVFLERALSAESAVLCATCTTAVASLGGEPVAAECDLPH